MNVLNKKLGKNGGFTLVEMLIVVAIIAILIAVSIPMMNSALEKARHAVDDANERDIIALATIDYLTDPDSYTKTVVYSYKVEANQGSLDKTGEAGNVTGNCTGADPDNLCKGDAANRTSSKKLFVSVDKDGNAKAIWAADLAAAKTAAGITG